MDEPCLLSVPCKADRRVKYRDRSTKFPFFAVLWTDDNDAHCPMLIGVALFASAEEVNNSIWQYRLPMFHWRRQFV